MITHPLFVITRIVDIIFKMGLQKAFVVQQMTSIIQPILEKEIIYHSIMHTLLLEFFSIADKVLCLLCTFFGIWLLYIYMHIDIGPTSSENHLFGSLYKLSIISFNLVSISSYMISLSFSDLNEIKIVWQLERISIKFLLNGSHMKCILHTHINLCNICLTQL